MEKSWNMALSAGTKAMTNSMTHSLLKKSRGRRCSQVMAPANPNMGSQAVTDPHRAPASGNTLGALGTSGGRKNACRIW